MDEPKSDAPVTQPAQPESRFHDAEMDAAWKLFDNTFDAVTDKLPPPLRDRVAMDITVPTGTLADLAKITDVSSDDVLHHYTTGEGIFGIVTTGCFHASAAYFMNDSREIDYGCDLFASMLSECHREHSIGASSRAMILGKLQERFSNVAQMRHLLARIYVVCFCEDPNLLSQWRTYGQNGGHSIGFKRTALEEFRTDATGMRITLAKVVYEEASQRALLKPFVGDAIRELSEGAIEEAFKGLPPKGQATFIEMYRFLFEIYALRQIVRFKHPALKEEKEWRLIASPFHHHSAGKFFDSEHVQFKPSRGIPIPYLELKPKENPLPITSVRFGPTLDRKRVEHSLEMLFYKKGYPEVAIDGSDIPVRL